MIEFDRFVASETYTLLLQSLRTQDLERILVRVPLKITMILNYHGETSDVGKSENAFSGRF